MLSLRIKFTILAIVAPVQLQTLKVTAWRHYIRQTANRTDLVETFLAASRKKFALTTHFKAFHFNIKT
jgi:hypothetical protein